MCPPTSRPRKAASLPRVGGHGSRPLQRKPKTLESASWRLSLQKAVMSVRTACASPFGPLRLSLSPCTPALVHDPFVCMSESTRRRWRERCLTVEANHSDHWLASGQVPETAICTADESKAPLAEVGDGER